MAAPMKPPASTVPMISPKFVQFSNVREEPACILVQPTKPALPSLPSTLPELEQDRKMSVAGLPQVSPRPIMPPVVLFEPMLP